MSSGASLLDVNVLVAMLWPAHQAHDRVQQWLGRHAREGWATCPFTQAALVRILSNPAFSPQALAPAEAMRVLEANLTHPSHVFWPDHISLAAAVKPLRGRIRGHQQIIEAYLLGLAIHTRSPCNPRRRYSEPFG